MDQLEQHPHRNDWTLEIGGNIHVVRKGNTLQVVTPGQGLDNGRGWRIPWHWTVVSIDRTGTVPANGTVPHVVTLSVPYDAIGSDMYFFSSTLDHIQDILGDSTSQPSSSPSSLWFTPPWRGSPIKVRQFLRGQRIPIHERGRIPLLFLGRRGRTEHFSGDDDDNNNDDMSGPSNRHDYQLVGVQVEATRWVIANDFSPNVDDASGEGVKRVTISVSPAPTDHE
jgi:hypothetical protein